MTRLQLLGVIAIELAIAVAIVAIIVAIANLWVRA
jgi:hypothetical protein